MNSKMISNLKRYINNKRPKVGGTTAASVKNAGGSNNLALAAANAAVQASPNASPGNVGERAANAVQNAGGNATVQAAAAAGAAKNHALAIGAPPSVANSEASNAAANAAANATKNPNVAANAAAEGAAAANAPPNAQANAARNAHENVSENLGVESGQGVNLNSLKGAIRQNTNAFNSARARTEKLRLQVLLRKLGGINKLNQTTRNNVNTYNRKLNAKLATRPNPLLSQAAAHQANVLKKTVKAPNGTNVVVVRKNASSPWNINSINNRTKYNINNRNKNTPTITNQSNVSTGNLFKQGN